MSDIKITRAGQLRVGDKIKIIAKSKKNNYDSVTVKNVVNPGGIEEEIIINSDRNHFFAIDMYINGWSWVSEVYKIQEKKI